MRAIGRMVVFALLPAAVLLPVSIFATIACTPMWRWAEDQYRIESVGHHGPAEWCYWATYGALLSGTYILLIARARVHRKPA